METGTLPGPVVDVEAVGANRMMGGVLTSGISDSGYGATIGGFYGSGIDFIRNLQNLKSKMPEIDRIVQYEENGFIAMLAAFGYPSKAPLSMASFRREPHKFFNDLSQFLRSTKARTIVDLQLTGSLGSMCLTILYRSVMDADV